MGQLEYSCSIPETFSIGFWFKKTAPLTDCFIAEMRGNKPNQTDYIAVKDMTFTVDSYEAQHLGVDGIWRDITLYIGYDKRTDSFYVRDTVNERILSLQIDTADRDWLFSDLHRVPTSGFSSSVNSTSIRPNTSRRSFRHALHLIVFSLTQRSKST